MTSFNHFLITHITNQMGIYSHAIYKEVSLHESILSLILQFVQEMDNMEKQI